MTDLRDILELATDRVEPTGGAAGALATARRRRRTRRGVAASAAVVVVVAGVVAVGQVGNGPGVQPEPAPSVPTRNVDPAPTTFDPRGVDDLPTGELAPLPAELEVPTSSTPTLAEDPVEAAVLTFGRSDALKVLGVDGRWRHVSLPVEGGSAELTDDGTRLLVQTADGVDIWDVTTGERTSVPLPPEPANEIGWAWLDDTLVVFDLGRAWVVDEATGDAGRRIDRDVLWMVGVDVDWSEADDSLAVSAPGGRLLVRDDDQATFANGNLSAQALLADGRVLLRVGLPRRDDGIRFVLWDPRTDALTLVMRTSEGLPDWSVAQDQLG